MDIAGRHAYPAGVQVPVVLYMHGCTGWSHQDDVYRTLLTAEGYAVFMPNSFARPGRRQCREQGALADRVTLRTAEVEYALAQIHELEWVDRDRVILMGYSEGGNTTDNWSKPGFAAHMIMGSAYAGRRFAGGAARRTGAGRGRRE